MLNSNELPAILNHLLSHDQTNMKPGDNADLIFCELWSKVSFSLLFRPCDENIIIHLINISVRYRVSAHLPSPYAVEALLRPPPVHFLLP